MPFDRKIKAAEKAFTVAAVAVALILHIVLLANVGGFWRDEVSSVLLARAPSWSAMYAGLITDSFPALWVTLLRCWDVIGFGAGDAWLRLAGFAFSIGCIVALWANSRLTGARAPVLAIALVVFNPAVFYWGNSLRAYALAQALIVLLFGLIWRVAQRGGRLDLLAAAVTAVLAAHANYQSSYLILAICTAGAVVASARRLWKRAAAILGVGLVAAVTLFPYRPVIQAYNEGAAVLRDPKFNALVLLSRFVEGFEGVEWIALPLLGLALVLLVILPFYYFRGRKTANGEEAFLESVFALITVTISVGGFFYFARAVGFPTQCWYYIPILGLAAVSIETSLKGVLANPRVRLIRIFAALLLVVASVTPLWDQAHIRRTNIDAAAAEVTRGAEPRDLVLVNPFCMGLTFDHYYKGRAPWSLLPVVPDEQRLMTFGAEIPLMKSWTPLKTTFERIEQTLRNGGRIWFVGGLTFLSPGKESPPWHPAPHPRYGWQQGAFRLIWSIHTGEFIQQHAMRRSEIKIDANQVGKFENIGSILIAEGWKE